MEKVLAGGLDIGTSGCKIALYDENCAFVRDAYCPYDVSRSGGLHEIDVTAVFDAVKKVIKEADCSAVSAIAVTSFGETFTMLDENDNVCAPSMLYTDPRGKEAVMHLTERFGKEEMAFKTGTKMHEMYSLPKLMWIKENMPEAFSRAKKILLMQDYIVYMLSGVRQIDFSLAARTACFDIENKCWDEELLNFAGIDPSLLSAPVPTGTAAGTVRPVLSRELGVKCGAVINPDTSVEEIENIIEYCDMVLLMSVFPGFGGQKFIDGVIPKIEKVKKIVDATGKEIDIEVDGGITFENVGAVKKAGANVIVAGSTVFNHPDRKEAIRLLRDL